VTARDCKGEAGTCGFCGFGEGYLGEQGDETTTRLHAAVRSGEPGNWTYEAHPNALPATECQLIVWCGMCVGGLAHKWQRYDDTNLRALMLSTQLRLEMDGLRWTLWQRSGDEDDPLVKYGDDPAVHLEKLRAQRDLEDMNKEVFRRYGHDLTKMYPGWRP
jgi:hypothetical protein